MERALIGRYKDTLEEVIAGLNAGKLPLAVEIARVPEQIRGYGHVKQRHLEAALPKWEALMAQWRGGEAVSKAA